MLPDSLWLNLPPELVLLLGIVAIVIGARWLIDAALVIALRYGISEAGVGMTLLAFTTTVPELTITLVAGARGEGPLAFATLFGSSIINLFFIAGLVGLYKPLLLRQRTVFRELPFNMLSLLLLGFFLNDHLVWDVEGNQLNRFEGILLLLLFFVFQLYVVTSGNTARKERRRQLNPEPTVNVKYWILLFKFTAGLLLVTLGGEAVVNSSLTLAKQQGVSATFISLLVLSPGASLPEIITTAIALARGRGRLAIGNILGANVYNTLFVLGGVAILQPLNYNYYLNFDLIFYLAGTVLFYISMFTQKRPKLSRVEAFLMLALFGCYYAFAVVRQ